MTDVARVTIDMLPDVALLEIFDFYEDEIRIEAWHTLVQVCRKWRNLVFGSPRRLNTSEGDAGNLATVAYCRTGE